VYFTLSDQAPAQFIDLDSVFIDSLIPGTDVHDLTAVSLTDSTGYTVYYPEVVPGGVEVLVPTDVNDGTNTDLLPTEFALSQNYPNPFNPTTTIDYALAERTKIQLIVYNLLGQPVKVLVDATQPAGTYSAVWDGTDRNGGQAASGVYFYRLIAGDNVLTKKMMLLK
jgi:hypothetical protein